MTLTKITFRNFKGFGFGPVPSVPFNKISLLYGANSSGKSTIIQVLLLLKQSYGAKNQAGRSVLEFRGRYVDLGGFRTVAHKHNMKRTIDIAIGYTPSQRRTYIAPSPTDILFYFEAPTDDVRESRMSRLELLTTQGMVRFVHDDRLHGMKVAEETSSKIIASSYRAWLHRMNSSYGGSLPKMDDADERWLRTWIRTHPCETIDWFPYWPISALRSGKPGRPIGGSSDAPRRELLERFILNWQRFIFDLASDVESDMESIVYVGPLRAFPRRMSVDIGEESTGLDARGERLVWHLARNPEQVEQVNNALTMLELPYHLNVELLSAGTATDAIGDVAVATLTNDQGLVVSPADVGFGVSQVLPVIVQAVGNRSSLIIVEQPEIHLHPRLQSRFTDVMIESMRTNKNRFLIETHSEHILLRSQRRIKQIEPKLRASDLGVYYVSGGKSGSIVKIDLSDEGDMLTPWPDGFFDERLEDLFSGLSSQR